VIPVVTDRPIPLPATASARVLAQDGSVIATVARSVRLAEPGPEAVVSVQGDLDLDTAPLAQETLAQALAGAERVCLDLSEVRFFGAAGVGVVITARLQATTLGRDFRFSGAQGITKRILTLTGLYPEA
jgi:anti-anti-sigma factor